MAKNKISPKFIVGIIAVALVAGFIGGAATNRLIFPFLIKYQEGSLENKVSQVIQPVKLKLVEEESKIIGAIKKVSPSVVSIVVTKDLQIIKRRLSSPLDNFLDDPFFDFNFPLDDFFLERSYPENKEGAETYKQKVGGGTGFIITADGMIMTNKHVVSDPEAEYTVILNDGAEHPTKVVSLDPINDIAVLQIKPVDNKRIENLPVITLGDSSNLQIGQSVIAIGNALAEYENSVTTGVISAKGREIVASDAWSGRGESLRGLIQTDAAINPGNSGGPLVNLEGEVIGMNTAIAARAQGIGFAIPINVVKNAIESIQKHGRILRPILGVRYIQLNSKVAEEYEINIKEGALLIGNRMNREYAVIPDKPADKAGLKEMDIILEVNGKKLTTEKGLQDTVMEYSPGDTITLEVWRDGKTFEVKVTLEENTAE
ncbi:MAG TPA: PDZ domain-containing protein [Candidatus Marinimicrobia bacterium]|nr:PDZ domain-containing protein [Candidatus Neomarinimicrobiota bacterium]